ncbi:MAG: PA2778 family cysteine peptidase [Formivibrio sp.]|nr:PA2778 family cysteine peptidase [Formivibrio sp.]
MSRWHGWFAAVLLLCLAGCTSIPQADYGTKNLAGVPDRQELTETPFYPQEAYQCGPAALATVFGSAGVVRSPQDLKDEVYLPQRQGSLQPEMLATARRAGLLAYLLEPQPRALLQEVAAGHPVVVLQNLRFKMLPQWHYAVVVGYDLGNGSIVLRSGSERRLTMSIADFDRSWAKSDRWAFVALPPDRLPATVREDDFVEAATTLERADPAAARRAYQTALAAWPQNLIARIASGNVAYHLHQLDVAQAEYQQATIDHPDSADAWNNLAQVLYEMGKWQQARDTAKRAVSIGGPRLKMYESTLLNIEAGAAR